jgi:phenylalanyl-tRNA synthetase alpha chain
MLHALAQRPFEAKKYFSIDRVFRNETLDATHLAEFHQVRRCGGGADGPQVEGIIIDRNLGLADLISVLEQFYNKLGITRLRFKPTYNPYTEPSMEVYSFHPGLNKWSCALRILLMG